MRGMEKRVWVAHGKWTEAGDDQVSITTRAEGKEGGKEGREIFAYKQAIIRYALRPHPHMLQQQ